MAELLTVARPYAKAAFEYARDNSALDTWSEALGFVGQVVVNEEVRHFLSSPKLENEQKVSLLVGVLPSQPDEAFERFLTNLARQNRLVALKAIAELSFALWVRHATRSLPVNGVGGQLNWLSWMSFLPSFGMSVMTLRWHWR